MPDVMRHDARHETGKAQPMTVAEGAPERIDRLLRENAELRAAVQARDHFISVAAHELRNPVTPLLVQIESLRRMAPLGADGVPARLAEGLARLEMIAARYVRRMNTLLDISRLSSGQLRLTPAPIDIAAAVGETAAELEPFARAAGCALSMSIEADLPGFHDRTAIEEIVENLLSNAIKYGSGRPVSLSLAREAETVRLCVRDHGIGISPDDQARIFARFERVAAASHVGGFGLGLWVVGQLTQAMGGGISVESRPGEGSAFTVRLPLRMAAEGAGEGK